MGVNQNIKIVLEVEETGCNRGGDKPDDERPRYGRICKGHLEYRASRVEFDAIDAFRQCWEGACRLNEGQVPVIQERLRVWDSL